MAQYTPPIRDMQFVLHELLDAVPTLKHIPAYAELDADIVNHILEEAGKFAAGVLQPLNLPGDREGCTLDYVPEPGRPWPQPRTFLSSNLAFGGHNATVVLGSV